MFRLWDERLFDSRTPQERRTELLDKLEALEKAVSSDIGSGVPELIPGELLLHELVVVERAVSVAVESPSERGGDARRKALRDSRCCYDVSGLGLARRTVSRPLFVDVPDDYFKGVIRNRGPGDPCQRLAIRAVAQLFGVSETKVREELNSSDSGDNSVDRFAEFPSEAQLFLVAAITMAVRTTAPTDESTLEAMVGALIRSGYPCIAVHHLLADLTDTGKVRQSKGQDNFHTVPSDQVPWDDVWMVCKHFGESPDQDSVPVSARINSLARH